MSNQLDGLFQSIDRKKLSELKKKAESGELSNMLDAVDAKKAEKMIEDFGLKEQVKNVDLAKLIRDVKKNPDVLEKLKKLF